MIVVTDIPTPDEVMTVREAAELLGVTPNMVRYHMLRQPELLPTWEQGGVTVLRRADVEHFRQSRQQIVRRS